jgi:Reverse transcriptase (RNA-dependent DNA polymerase)
MHRPPRIALIDLSKSLSPEDKNLFAEGIKLVKLSKKEINQAESDISKCPAITTRKVGNKLIVQFEKQRACWLRSDKTTGFGFLIPPDQASQLEISTPKPSLTSRTLAKFKELRNKGVFKKADKGPTLVYMTKDYYRRIALKQLSKSNYAISNGKEVEAKSLKAVREIIAPWRTSTTKFGKKLRVTKLKGDRVRRIYFLPKVHKDPDTDGLIKIRPIVDCLDTPLAEIDKFCAAFLKPLQTTMSDIAMKDNIAALDILRKTRITASTVFLSMDVEDLYTNCPIQESIDRTIELARLAQIGSEEERSTVSKLLLATLKGNVFQFADNQYLQVDGLPMGSNSAPLLADCFMYSLEKPKVLEFRDRGCTVMRYRDDILAICPDLTMAKEIEEMYKGLHKNLKLTTEVSEDNANFLDIKVRKFLDTGSIRLGMFYKATDTLEPIDWRSEHTRETLRGTLYSKALRIIRTVNNRSDLFSAIANMLAACKRRKYPWYLPIKELTKALEFATKNRWPYRKKKSATEEEEYRTTTLLTYSKHLNPVYKVMKRRKMKVARTVGKPVLSHLQRTGDH